MTISGVPSSASHDKVFESTYPPAAFLTTLAVTVVVFPLAPLPERPMFAVGFKMFQSSVTSTELVTVNGEENAV